MMAFSVTPPVEEEEGTKVDGTKRARGVTVSVCGRFGRSWASFRQTDTTLMAPMTVKGEDLRQGIKEW